MADTPVVVPHLGTEVNEALVESWARQPGDSVQAGELLLTITTPKVSLEVDAPVSGVLAEVLAQADEIVTVGATVATIKAA